MKLTIPKIGGKLSNAHIDFLKTFATSCRRSIIEMTTNAASGHPGGSLSCVDYLSLIYAYRLSQTGEKIVVSNGHISPAVYAVLAELGYINKKDVVEGFRKAGKIFEGHVTRHVPGVWYGTGPLGAGISAASGFALAEKLKNSKEHVFALLGDGEAEEGQVYEMMNFAKKYKLNNFVAFMDYNQVQLSDSLKSIMPFDPRGAFEAAGWHVIDVNGHDFEDMWLALNLALKVKEKPTLLLGNTIMGQGVDFMQETGEDHKSTWHGKATKPEQAEHALHQLEITKEEEKMLATFRKKNVKWKPEKVNFTKPLTKTKILTGTPRLYTTEELTDCRSAYGLALLDLAKKNKNVVALTADVGGSVKTTYVKKEFPERHIECGIAEQQMVSCSGGLSLNDVVPFCSTFGAFMTSRAKDQARVNDINQTNVKMVATHCGLSVGEDGPTHQAIDDLGSMLGLLNTMTIEPADPNQTDRIIRYIASHYGNFYVRMGRHKYPVITKKNGKPFYDKNYKYVYGKCDVLRKGKDVTIVASGASCYEALVAQEALAKMKIHAEVVAVSSLKKFDQTLLKSIKKTKKVIVVQDHNVHSGLGNQLASALLQSGMSVKSFVNLGVEEYQLSGTASELYKAAGIDSDAIVAAAKKIK
jgi:transketolase